MLHSLETLSLIRLKELGSSLLIKTLSIQTQASYAWSPITSVNDFQFNLVLINILDLNQETSLCYIISCPIALWPEETFTEDKRSSLFSRAVSKD